MELMAHPNTSVNHDEGDVVRRLAQSMDCITSSELRALANITESTEEAWRKRGTGPDYVRIGNRVLYPRAALSAFLKARTRERPSPIASTL